jgi:hypothetical protein
MIFSRVGTQRFMPSALRTAMRTAAAAPEFL